jgi:hypothetical protein
MPVLPQVATIDGDLTPASKQGSPELVAHADSPSLSMQAPGYLLHSETSREPVISQMS